MLGLLGLSREATLVGCTVLAIVALVVLVARFKLNAFLALMLASLFVGCIGPISFTATSSPRP